MSIPLPGGHAPKPKTQPKKYYYQIFFKSGNDIILNFNQQFTSDRQLIRNCGALFIDERQIESIWKLSD